MELTIKDVLEATGGELVSGSGVASAAGVSIDSRKIRAGELFVAIKGDSFDGHSFINGAAIKGAIGAVVTKVPVLKTAPPSFSVIRVEDTLKALGDIANFERKRAKARILAISGTTGKTTTKEMIAAILERSVATLKTQGNMNNLIGMPLTLFGLTTAHEAAIVELGISEAGEMTRLAEICAPDVALITNVGRGHLEGLRSLEGVAEEKAKLYAALKDDGVMVVNIDDEWVVRASEQGRGKETVTFGIKEGADVHIEETSPDGLKGLDVKYNVRGQEVRVRFNSPLVSNPYNGAAAIAMVLAGGFDLKDASEALGSIPPMSGRMEVVRTKGLTLVDDTYNSNPDSMEAALKTLAGVDGRRVVVLGDMLELGEGSEEAHSEAGALAASLGFEVIVAVGRFAPQTLTAATEGGVEEVYNCKDNREAAEKLATVLKENDTVLVKGSRAAKLEEVVKSIKDLVIA